MTRIFISHSTTDDDFTNKLMTELQARGYQTWVDHFNIPAGVAWIEVVEQALQQCDVMLLLLSEKARQSRHVETEWHAFYDNNKPIIPLIVRPCAKPLLLSVLQHIDFSDTQRYNVQLDALLSVLPPPTPHSEPLHLDTPHASVSQHTGPLRPIRTPRDEKHITQTVGTVTLSTEEDTPRVGESEVLFVFPKFNQTLMYKLNEPLVIGWYHESVSGRPDVDLTPFNPQRYGISRRHAMLVQTRLGLMLTDLESRNGTYIGRQKLIPHQPIALTNQAMVRFGNLVAQVYFKASEGATNGGE